VNVRLPSEHHPNRRTGAHGCYRSGDTDKMAAQIDGKHTIHGESARIDVDKIDFSVLLGAVSGSLDNVKAYELE
jgi:hypothetical protein